MCYYFGNENGIFCGKILQSAEEHLPWGVQVIHVSSG